MLNIDSITVNRNPTSDTELSNKNHIDDELDKYNTLRFNPTLTNYLKNSVRNDTYNLTTYGKIQITDTTISKYPNIGGYLLENWNIKCNNKNIAGKIQNFLRSTKTNSPTGDSGAISLPPIGDSFVCVETSKNNFGDNVYVSWERTDIIQITNIKVYHNRFSILTNDSLKSMGRFGIQLLSQNNSWSTQYIIAKNTQYNDNSTDWTLLNLNFTVKNFDIKLIYDQIDTALAGMCFSIFTITHSV